MALANQTMGAGFSAIQAGVLGGTVKTGITAAGTTQGGATSLTAGINMIGTAAASTGVVCPLTMPGDDMWIYNGGANAVSVYPPSGAKFNSLSTNAAFSLGTNTNCVVKCVSATQWLVIMSA